MKKIKIAFFDAKPYDIDSFNKVNKGFNYEIKYFNNHLNKDTVSLVKGYDFICAFVNDYITRDVLDIIYKNKIELIALRSAGYNNVDLKSTYGKIHVVRVPAYSPYAVAEHAVGLMLSLNRKIHKAYSRTRDSNFSINGLLGFDMNNKNAGIIGTGKIGKILIKILKGFGMNIFAYDLYEDISFAKELDFKYVKDINFLYKQSDIISLNCPLTKDSYHMINKKAISKMKKGIMLINTSRGQLIDTKALIKGLKKGIIGSAGLDVYEEESEYFFEDFSLSVINDDILARLLTFNNVLITSHQGFFTKEALYKIAFTTLNNIKEYFFDNKLTNEICYRCNNKECNKKKYGFCFNIKKQKAVNQKEK